MCVVILCLNESTKTQYGRKHFIGIFIPTFLKYFFLVFLKLKAECDGFK